MHYAAKKADDTVPDLKSAPRTNIPTGHRWLLVEPTAAISKAFDQIPGEQFVVARFATLDAGLLAGIMPDVIIAPLLGPSFDILDIATRLEVLGYTGALRATTTPLPNPRAVIAEVRACAPGLDFDLLVLAPSAPPSRG